MSRMDVKHWCTEHEYELLELEQTTTSETDDDDEDENHHRKKQTNKRENLYMVEFIFVFFYFI